MGSKRCNSGRKRGRRRNRKGKGEGEGGRREGKEEEDIARAVDADREEESK
jgi:hypothetical protein